MENEEGQKERLNNSFQEIFYEKKMETDTLKDFKWVFTKERIVNGINMIPETINEESYIRYYSANEYFDGRYNTSEKRDLDGLTNLSTILSKKLKEECDKIPTKNHCIIAIFSWNDTFNIVQYPVPQRNSIAYQINSFVKIIPFESEEELNNCYYKL